MSSTFRRLNARIVFFKSIRQDDHCGGFSEKWQPLGAAWASIAFKNLSHPTHHNIQGMRLGGMASKDQVFQIIMRDHIIPTTYMRFTWGQKLLSVISDPMPAPEKGLIIFYAALLKAQETPHDIS